MATTCRIHLQTEPEGGFTVTVPALPGCVTWGGSREHALAMAREAIEGHLEALVKAGLAVPRDPAADEMDDVVIFIDQPAA